MIEKYEKFNTIFNSQLFMIFDSCIFIQEISYDLGQKVFLDSVKYLEWRKKSYQRRIIYKYYKFI